MGNQKTQRGMKVAYLILAHTSPAMLAALVNALNKPGEAIFVHIDKKTPIQPFEQLLAGQCTFIEQRENVSWGGFSTIRATLNLMKAAAGDFDYYCLLSGCDYPIKPVTAFEAHLAAHPGNEYIRSRNMAGLSPRLKKRYTGFFLLENRVEILKTLNYGVTKVQRLFYERKPYNNRSMYYGSQWWTLTGACVRHIISFIATHPGCLSYFKYTLLADEMFFQTIIARSPFSDRVQDDNLRYIVFEGKKPHPKVWRLADSSALLQSPAFFARKFDLSVDSHIIDFLKNRYSHG
jgi:hypothetical protein